MRDFEKILPRRVPRNPQPRIYHGGDCGACCLSGVTDLAAAAVYEELRDDKKINAFSQPDMRSALSEAEGNELLQNIVVDSPNWIGQVYRAPFGYNACQMSLEWFGYIRMAIEAGYYGIAEVKTHGAADKDKRDTDHWCMICGVRVRHEKSAAVEGAWTIVQEILISDSCLTMPAEHWEEVNAFLRDFGGFDCFLVKPN
jgi:hypothetical protein